MNQTAIEQTNEIQPTISATELLMKKYEGRDPETIIKEIGGTDRGCINRTIYHFNGLGLSKGQIAKLIGKRFQHVRNVLHNQKLAKAKATTTTIPAAPVELKTEIETKDEVVVPVEVTKEVEVEVEVEPKIETMTTKGGITLPKTGFKSK